MLPPRRPTRRPVSSWRQHNRWQMVWPNDKHQGVWGRWKDIFTNKGPDIFVAEQSTPEPERPIWSNWYTRGAQHPDDPTIRWDDEGRPFRPEEHYMGRFIFQNRDHNSKYDFRTRKYRRPDDNIWSGVKYSRTKPYDPIEFRDMHGIWYSRGR